MSESVGKDDEGAVRGEMRGLADELDTLRRENARLRAKEALFHSYIREKVNQLLSVMGTQALKPEELDDQSLIELDPIGIVSDSFVQVLDHLNKTNASLKSARDEISAILDSVGVGVLVVDKTKTIVECNRSMKQLFAPREKEINGRPCHEIICRSCRSGPERCIFREVMERQATCQILDWVHGEQQFDVMGSPIFDETGGIHSLVLVYMDISERKAAEEKLRLAKENAELVYRLVPSAIFTVDRDNRIVSFNNKATELTGYQVEEVIGGSCTRFAEFPCTDSCCLRENDCPKPQVGVECLIRRKDGALRTILKNVDLLRDKNGDVIGGIESFEDITERKEMEEELARTSKLESLGVLAGGLAHDFNNLLTSILGNVSLVRHMLSSEPKISSLLASCEKASLRAKDLTGQLLTFARGGTPVKKTASLPDLINDSVDFTLRGSNVKCSIALENNLWPLNVDEGQISQVIQNLVINARQAMPDGGLLELSAANVELGVEEGVPLAPGRYVVLNVRDHGPGIAQANLCKIFDPYFTTKAMGTAKGTGLGLAICYSIVKKHDGLITVHSTTGKGTLFTVYLPAADTHVGTSSSATSEKSSASERSPGGRILIMDDEEQVRMVAVEMIRYIGFQVDCAENGKQALAMYGEAMRQGAPYDVVLLDLTIPGGIGGKEVVGELKKMDPRVRAVVSSGYANDPVLAHYAAHGFADVIGKPYRLEELRAVLTAHVPVS